MAFGCVCRWVDVQLNEETHTLLRMESKSRSIVDVTS